MWGRAAVDYIGSWEVCGLDFVGRGLERGTPCGRAGGLGVRLESLGWVFGWGWRCWLGSRRRPGAALRMGRLGGFGTNRPRAASALQIVAAARSQVVEVPDSERDDLRDRQVDA